MKRILVTGGAGVVGSNLDGWELKIALRGGLVPTIEYFRKVI